MVFHFLPFVLHAAVGFASSVASRVVANRLNKTTGGSEKTKKKDKSNRPSPAETDYYVGKAQRDKELINIQSNLAQLREFEIQAGLKVEEARADREERSLQISVANVQLRQQELITLRERLQHDKQLSEIQRQQAEKALQLREREIDMMETELAERRKLSLSYMDFLRAQAASTLTLKLNEIQAAWDRENWPGLLSREETRKIWHDMQQNPHLLMLVSPPDMSEDCPDSFIRNLQMEVRNELKEFMEQHYALQGTTCPVEFYGKFFKSSVFDTEVKQLETLLAPIPTAVIYSDMTDDRLFFHIRCWGVDEPFSLALSWAWEQEKTQFMQQAGLSEKESLKSIRQAIVSIHQFLAAFLSDLYYLSINPYHQPRVFDLMTQLPVNSVEPYFESLKSLQETQLREREQFMAMLEEERHQAEESANNRVTQGIARLAMEDFQGAIAACTEALKYYPTCTEAYIQRGVSRFRSEDYAGAIADFDVVLQERTHSAEVYIKRGLARLRTADLAGAVADFEQALSLRTEDRFIAQLLTQARQGAEKTRLASQRKPGMSIRDALKQGGEGPEMIVLPPGRFYMGGTKSDNEKPVHEVTIAYAFAMGKYPVTFAEYDVFCDATRREKPSDNGWGRGRRPVVNVSWQDATAFCEWLSSQTGKTYRLPTEAEWEYACRAGTTTEYWWGDTMDNQRCWYDGNSGGKTHVVDEKTDKHTNSFGLCDMHGNVWEWCQDVWHDNYVGAPTEGSAWMTGGEQGQRLLRGGSWDNGSFSCRSACRLWCNLVLSCDDYGFRIGVLFA